MLMEALDKVLEENQGFRPRSGFYASDLGKCARWIAYDFREDIPRPPLTARKIRIFREGKELEENLASEFKLLNWKYIREVPLRTDFVSGRADFLLENPFPMILEAKTCSPFMWSKLTQPLREHILQVCFYLNCAELKTGVFIYENKGNQERKEFRINLADYQSDLKSAIDHLKSLAEMDFHKQLPPRAYFRNDFHCRNCDYYLVCQSGYPQELEETNVPKNIQKLTLAYLQAKDKEDKLKQKLSKLQNLLHNYFDSSQEQEIITESGSLARQKRETVSYDSAILKSILEPLGYWDEVIKIDSQAVKGLLQKGQLTDQQLEAAREIKTSYALVFDKKN